MTQMFIACILMLIGTGISVAEDAEDGGREHFQLYRETWEAFKKKFDRQYSQEEETIRYNVFVKNLQMIKAHNKEFQAGRQSFSMDISQFADQTDEDFGGHSCHVDEGEDQEMEWTYRHKRQTGFCRPFSPPRSFTPPRSLDWKAKGFVTPVGDQGDCESCYSFGVTATIEAQLKMTTGKLIPLSQQQLIDCHRQDCKGSNAEASFLYINAVGGIMSRADYPYRTETFASNARAGPCNFDRAKVQTNVSGCWYSLKNENQLKSMVASQGPVYVSVAIPMSFKMYKGSVYSVSECNSKGRHCLTVVGYGHDQLSGKDYWIVKNSWGPEWGDKAGYAWIERGKNMCGIGDRITVPIIGGKTSRGKAVLTGVDDDTHSLSSSAGQTVATILSFLLSLLAVSAMQP